MNGLLEIILGNGFLLLLLPLLPTVFLCRSREWIELPFNKILNKLSVFMRSGLFLSLL